eukprot:scaffold461_cov157-Ochromonas_danica.AAC.6
MEFRADPAMKKAATRINRVETFLPHLANFNSGVLRVCSFPWNAIAFPYIGSMETRVVEKQY